MSIQCDVKELQDLNTEIQRLLKEVKRLRDRKKEVENNIKMYLDENDQPGVKYQGIAVTIASKKGRIAINESAKKEKLREILKEHGITSDFVISNVIESVKGVPVNKSCIKIHKIKN